MEVINQLLTEGHHPVGLVHLYSVVRPGSDLSYCHWCIPTCAQNGNFGYNILYAVIIIYIYIIHTYKMVVIMSIYSTYIYIYTLNDYRLFYTYSIYSLWGTPHKSYYAWLHINYGLPYLHRLLKPKQLLPPCLPHPLNQVLDPDLESWPAPNVSFQRNILWAETSDNYHRTFTTWLWQCIYLESFWLLAFHVGTKEDNQLTGCDRHLKPADHLDPKSGKTIPEIRAAHMLSWSLPRNSWSWFNLCNYKFMGHDLWAYLMLNRTYLWHIILPWFICIIAHI